MPVETDATTNPQQTATSTTNAQSTNQQVPAQTPPVTTPPPDEALNTERGVTTDGAAQPSQTEQETEENPARVPYARFQQMVEERNALQERIDAFETAEQERRDAELSDLQRAQNQATDLREQLQTANERIQELETAARQQALNASIERAARDARNIQQVITLLGADEALTTQLNAALAEDGTVDDTAVLAVVDGFRKANSHLFGTGHPGNPAHDEGRANGLDRKAMEAAMQADLHRSRGGGSI
jgi:uncharacterized protein YdcH (DUF465 family)